jgi:hypothetical protein
MADNKNKRKVSRSKNWVVMLKLKVKARLGEVWVYNNKIKARFSELISKLSFDKDNLWSTVLTSLSI